MAVMQRKKGFFSISAVAQMFSVHQQTIRLYEKEGLIAPKRSEGNTRLFSQEDVDRLEEIIHLTHNLGINLAGVEMILKLKKQIKKMQKDMNNLFEATQKELDQNAESAKLVVQSSSKRLMKLKQEQQKQPDSKPAHESFSTADQTEQTIDIHADNTIDTNWEIEYED